MCGIVGYLGKENGVERVLEGLRRLEYRGYDSAGVCFKDATGVLQLFKKAGQLKNLEAVLFNKDCYSNSCIGHTRWATHGGVSDVNAHPHLSDSIALDDDRSVAIVHNGIIENSDELKQEIEASGLKFTTETDSEVFLGLLVMALKNGIGYFEAVRQSYKRLKGNSAFVIQIKGHKEIIAIKKSAPLVCGINSVNGDLMVSSDPYALAGFVDQLLFPEDNVMCILSPNEPQGIRFEELDGRVSTRFMAKNNFAVTEVSQKGEFEHYMLKEIHEQPRLISNLLTKYAGMHDELKPILNSVKSDTTIHISACGTACHAGHMIRNFIENYAKIPCSVELASEFRYMNPLLRKSDIGLFISQSGETADTLAAQELCKEHNIKNLGIVNVDGSSLHRSCDANMLIHAGVEIGVASTKAFTMQVLAGRVFAEFLSGKKNLNCLQDKFQLLSRRIDQLLSNENKIKEVAEAIYNFKGFIFTGRGSFYPIALEGALKLKEIAYVHAEGYASGELKHGPIALIDENIVNIAIVGPTLIEKTISNIQEVKARKGKIVSIGPSSLGILESLSDYYLQLDFDGLEELSPLLANVATQQLAYYMARFKGTDIDKPRNLAKSVTVE